MEWLQATERSRGSTRAAAEACGIRATNASSSCLADSPCTHIQQQLCAQHWGLEGARPRRLAPDLSTYMMRKLLTH